MKNKKIYIYIAIVLLSVFFSITILSRHIGYGYKLSEKKYEVDTNGFDFSDGKYFSNSQNPSMDVFVDGKYSMVDIFFSGEDLSSISVNLFYSAREEYSEYVVTYANAFENGFVSMKLPESIDGSGYMHIEFNNNGSSFAIERMNFYERTLVLTKAMIVSAILVTLLVIILFLYYCRFYSPKYNKRIYAYIYILTSGALLFWIYAFLSRGGTLHTVLFTDEHDVFGDFFHSIADSLESNPYDKYSNYPPLALLIYKLFTYLLPSSYIGTKVTYEELMIYQPVIWGWLLLLFTGIYFVFSYLTDNLRLEGMPEKLLKIFIVFSAPMLYEIDRGNIVLIAFAFTVIYVKYYNSENKYLREISYLALAVAFAIKIYPAIFGILLVRQKRWFAAVRTALYGAVLLIIPFFYYGFSYGVSHFLEGISLNSGYDYGMGSNVSLANIMRTFLTIINLEWDEFAYKIILAIVVIILLITAFVVSNEHIALVSMCLLLLLIPRFNYLYAATFLIIPFVSFLKELDNSNDDRYCIKWGVLYACIMVPMALPVISKLSTGYKTYVTYGTLLQYLSLIIMVVYCGYELFIQLNGRKKR